MSKNLKQLMKNLLELKIISQNLNSLDLNQIKDYHQIALKTKNVIYPEFDRIIEESIELLNNTLE